MTRVLLLHGLGADRRAFQRFRRLLPDTWQIEAIDLLGHGEAPKPATGYSLTDHAEHVATHLERAAGDTPTIVVGRSYGAATATALAALRPELVRGIVLLDPVVGLSAEREGMGTAKMIAAKRAGTLEATVLAMYPDASPALQRWTIETWETMAKGVVNELDPDWTRFADRVTTPVAIIHGEQRLGGSGDLAADWFDEPSITQIDGAGHYLHATHARETAAAVIAAVTAVT